MLQASGLVKSFGGFQALAGCSLEIARQSITGIIGPNGAGKSTLFNVLGGLMLPEAGDVTFDGRSILRSEEHTSELQSHSDLVCRLLLEKKKGCRNEAVERGRR